MSAHLLLVEDDRELADWISEYLIQRGYLVTQCHNGLDAVTQIKSEAYELIILDGMLPGMDGLDVCREIRRTMNIPILMLTARDDEMDEILGLEMGADDYLTKPVRGRLLETRVKALLRRNAGASAVNQVEEQSITIGGLMVSLADRRVILAEQEINLSSKEFDTLWCLASQAGKPVSRDSLTQVLRGFEFDGFDRSIDLTISRLRKKLGDDGNQPCRIKTVWGKGYQLAKDTW